MKTRMKTRILLLILALVTLHLFIGCKESVSSSSSLFSPSLVLYPDSTVQISISQLPYRYSWVVTKDNDIADTLWNEVWNDTQKCQYELPYHISVLDSQRNIVFEENLSPDIIDETFPGLIIPTKNSRCIIGTKQVIKWNPISFPSESISISATVKHEFCDNIFSKTFVNKGCALFFLGRDDCLYGLDGFSKNISFHISPKDHPSPEAYTYSSDKLPLSLPNYTSIIIYPSINDTVSRGMKCTVQWDFNEIEGDSLYFSLRDKNHNRIISPYKIPNQGFYEWTVPNIGGEYYNIELYPNSGIILIGHPFFVIL